MAQYNCWIICFHSIYNSFLSFSLNNIYCIMRLLTANGLWSREQIEDVKENNEVFVWFHPKGFWDERLWFYIFGLLCLLQSLLQTCRLSDSTTPNCNKGFAFLMGKQPRINSSNIFQFNFYITSMTTSVLMEKILESIYVIHYHISRMCVITWYVRRKGRSSASSLETLYLTPL